VDCLRCTSGKLLIDDRANERTELSVWIARTVLDRPRECNEVRQDRITSRDLVDRSSQGNARHGNTLPNSNGQSAAEIARYRGEVVTLRRTICVITSTVVVATGIASAHSFATASPSVSTTTGVLITGRQLYRQFCGKCHALAAAHAAGFGSSSKSGLGALGGPSFNELRVPYTFSVTAVTEPTGGHEALRKKISSTQLSKVATFIAKVTSHNPIPPLSTDG
jgi:mono/diheme cytochrome c family protein